MGLAALILSLVQTWLQTLLKAQIPTRIQVLAHDPEIDIIYVVTPHSHHIEAILLCLNAGKHVLCEKPFTLNAAQARIVIDRAREKNLFLMEAVWMRFLPAIQELKATIESGLIGDIAYFSADFLINYPFDPDHRKRRHTQNPAFLPSSAANRLSPPRKGAKNHSISHNRP